MLDLSSIELFLNIKNNFIKTENTKAIIIDNTTEKIPKLYTVKI